MCHSHGQSFFLFFFFFLKVPIKLIDRSCHLGDVGKPSAHTFPRPHPCVFPAVGASVPASLCCSSFPPACLPLLSERYWLHPHPTEIPSFFQQPNTSFYGHPHIQDKIPPIWGSCSTCYTWGPGVTFDFFRPQVAQGSSDQCWSDVPAVTLNESKA